jgi:hypothetical protein
MLTYCRTSDLPNKPEPMQAPVYPCQGGGIQTLYRAIQRPVQMYPAQGDSSHHPEPNGSTSWTGGAGPVSRLAEDLALTLGCPVEVSYRDDTREIIAVARPDGGRQVRVSLTVSPMGLWLMENPFVALKYDLLKQLRRQMGAPQ